MQLPAKPENVAMVRHAIAGLAQEIGMDEPGVADLKTVVTEACMNVAVHAYEGRPGPLRVDASADPDGLEVTVADEGAGIRPQADTSRESLRLGLSLIAALCSSFSISGGLDRGTQVRMRVPLRGGGADAEGAGEGAAAVAEDEPTEVVVERADLLAPVLSRVVGSLAARRDLPVDRVSDAVLLTDAIAAAAPSRFADGRVRLGLDERPEGISLRLGPMEPGSARTIREDLELPGEGGSLESLADELAVEESGDGDYLVIRFASPR